MIRTEPEFQREVFKEEDLQHEQYRQICFLFSTTSQEVEIIECGVQIVRDRSGRKRSDADAVNINHNNNCWKTTMKVSTKEMKFPSKEVSPEQEESRTSQKRQQQGSIKSSSFRWRYRVFTSFHGPDVRKTFLTHLRKQFNCNGISMFDDQGIERGQTIAPALTQAIRESRISIVVLTKHYASSRWCLDELLGILKCKEEMGQIVMTIFYGVDPSDVRKQTGDFGKVFKETCRGKTEEERRRWSQSLTDVGNIAGEHFLIWDKESEMIEKIARDVSNKLNTTISRDFEDMVGIEAHLDKMQSLLHLHDEDGAMFVGICGPAGIGKTTIARALHSRLSSSFHLTCFMENLRGSCNSGLDEYGLKLRLQELLLSKIFNQNGMRIYHLGAIPERLCDQKVLIILDDVDDLQQLEALADETNWFGPGSRVIVTTEDQELLEQHDINNTYNVDFPTQVVARQIFCRFAFRQLSAPHGFEKLVDRVIKLCSNLPLGLRVMGSSLRRKKIDDWEGILQRLENSFDQKIDAVLRVGYNSLHKDDQFLFLLIACFFNYKDDDHVKAMLVDSNLDVRLGLKNLVYKSLIQISAEGTIVMHKLLQQVGREAVHLQEPRKRQILIDAHQICDVLENDSPLTNLKKMDLSGSLSLKEVPDLSNATSLKRLNLTGCWSLVEIPSSIGDLHKLEELEMNLCVSVEVFPTLLNLASLESLRMVGCWQLSKIPDLPTNIKSLVIGETMLQEFPESVRLWSHLHSLNIYGSVLTVRLLETTSQEFSLAATVERIPDWIKDFNGLRFLYIAGCTKLGSLPELPPSLRKLIVDNCESLETVCFPSDTPTTDYLYFPNCFKLCQEAKRVTTQQSLRAYFPGKEMPAAEFDDHRSFGSSLTIIRPAICKFRICLVLSPTPDMEEAYFKLLFRIRAKGCPSDEDMLSLHLAKILGEHLFIFHIEFVEHHEEMVFKFSTSSHEVDVTECGVQVLTDETSRRSNESCSEQVSEDGDDILSDDDKSNEIYEPRVKIFKGYTMFLSLVFTFLLSLISSLILYRFLKKH
uniref:ADP-ribosyl cyclase/cyclic ADP-ribose hydrolase n=1 Tax=Raphanus sativus TaxID=3726 RepID=D0R6J9_RAPSA|nr:putative disease resistance protein [Raphanus sativus]